MISIQVYRAAIGSFYAIAATRAPHNTGLAFSHCYHQNQLRQYYSPHDSFGICQFLKSLIFVTILLTISFNINLASLKLMLLLSGDVESNPGPVNECDVDFQIALQESYAQHLLNNSNFANQIVAHARNIGLSNIVYREITPGDGNCFYHAIVQQLRRREIQQLIPPQLHFQDHFQLRTAVVNFVRQNNDAPVCSNHRMFMTLTNEQWEIMLQNQSQPSIYVDEVFIRAIYVIYRTLPIITINYHTVATFRNHQCVKDMQGQMEPEQGARLNAT